MLIPVYGFLTLALYRMTTQKNSVCAVAPTHAASGDVYRCEWQCSMDPGQRNACCKKRMDEIRLHCVHREGLTAQKDKLRRVLRILQAQP